MREPIEVHEVNGFTVELYFDTEPWNPREWDNLGIMVCRHKRYNLGDEQFNPAHYNGWDDLKEEIAQNGAIEILPLYLYDHSGITISTTPFSCRWDSGQVGYIYTTEEQLDKMGSPCDRVTELLKSEVEEYDSYLRGEIYGWVLIDEQGSVVDSCWGYIGDKDYVIREAKATAEHYTRYRPVLEN